MTHLSMSDWLFWWTKCVMWPTLVYHSDSFTWLNVSNDTPEVCQMSYFSSAVCHWRDGMKTHFFVSYDTFKILCVYVRDMKNHNSAKKNLNVVPFQNGGQITDFYFASFWFWPNFEKPLSQRNFSWNLAQRRRIWIDIHYWNKILKKLFHFKMVAKTIFWYCAIMLIYAN